MIHEFQTKVREMLGLSAAGNTDTVPSPPRPVPSTEDEEPYGSFYARLSISEGQAGGLINKLPQFLETTAARLPNVEERILRLKDPTSPRRVRPNIEEVKEAQSHELIEAASRNDIARCKELLGQDSQAGSIAVNPNLLNLHGQAALHIAAVNGFLEVGEILLNFGQQIDVNLRDGQGRSALHLACLGGHVRMAEFLLVSGADINMTDSMGNSPLHYAAQSQSEDLVEVLLVKSPNLNMQNVKGETPADLTRGKLQALLRNPGLKKHVPPSTGINPTPFSRITIRDTNQEEVNIMMGLNERRSAGRPGEDSSVRKASPEDFELLQQLGKGSFGEVFLVKHMNESKLYAMKVLRKDKIMGQNLIKYALTERNVLSYVRHPFIVSLNYAFQTSDKLILILDYCPGGDMGWHLSIDKRFNEIRARLYACEVLLALEELHRRDIIFRDLKPDNVVFDEEGHAMLTDFGLSREGVYGTDSAKSFCGSIAYLAPEMLRRAGHGKAVDWYLLGVLIYEMLVGNPPYFSRNREQLFQNITSGALRLPSCLSPNAKSIIRAVITTQLLQREPTQRLGFARDAEEVKQHPFFAGVNWDFLLRRQSRPPSLPRPPLSPYAKVAKERVYGETRSGDASTYLAGWSFVSK